MHAQTQEILDKIIEKHSLQGQGLKNLRYPEHFVHRFQQLSNRELLGDNPHPDDAKLHQQQVQNFLENKPFMINGVMGAPCETGPNTSKLDRIDFLSDYDKATRDIPQDDLDLNPDEEMTADIIPINEPTRKARSM